MRLLLTLMLLLATALPAAAMEMVGVNLEPAVTVNGQTLKLNGAGIRKKFFVKVYIGSLYSAKRLATPAEALHDKGDRLIRMNFLHGKVEKGKIVEAFGEGFSNNAPDLANSAEVKKFLSLFTADFLRGDVVDLVLGADGSVVVRHNAKVLGSVSSARLAGGIMAIYFGDKPADEALKKGMLGG